MVIAHGVSGSYINAASKETRNRKYCVKNTVGYVTQLSVHSSNNRVVSSAFHHNVGMSIHPAPKFETALNMPTEQKVTKPRMTTWVHGELSRDPRSVSD